MSRALRIPPLPAFEWAGELEEQDCMNDNHAWRREDLAERLGDAVPLRIGGVNLAWRRN